MFRARALAAALVGFVLGALAIGDGASLDPFDPCGRAYVIDATLDPAARTITGTVETRFTNTTSVALGDVALVLFPNRFAGPEPGIDDVNRPFVYPREEVDRACRCGMSQVDQDSGASER